MAVKRAVMAAEGASNSAAEQSEAERTAARNPLANKGTQVWDDQTFTAYDDDLEQGVEGITKSDDKVMQVMGAFVLSPEEECIMENEIVRLRQQSFVVKVVGSRPNRPLLRDWLQSCLQENLGRMKDISFMGKGFYHVTVMPETNIDKIIESSPLTWHNARAYVFKWDVDFDRGKANAIIGNPAVITAFFPGLPKQWESFLPAIGKSMGGQCLEKTFAERVSETPRMKLIVSDVKALPQSIVLSSKLMPDHVQPVEYAGLPGQCFICRKMGHMARECPRGKESMHLRNGKHGWKSPTTQQKNMTTNHATWMNEEGWKYMNNKGKQKIRLGQEWLPLSNKYELLTLEDNENIANDKEARSKAHSESNFVNVINDMQMLQHEDNVLESESNQMHKECRDEVGEISCRKDVSPLKGKDKLLVTTQHIKGIAKMKRHMRASKEEENGMGKNKGMCKWSRVKWNPQYKVTPLSNTGQQIKLKLTGKKWFKEMCGAEMKKDSMCRINIYSNCEDEGQIAGLSYMLVAGNKEPQNREEALGWLEQQMGAHVDATYGTTISVKMKRQWKDAMIWSSGKANEQGICYINVKFRKLPRIITEFMVYHLDMVTLEEDNLQDMILANLVEAENAVAGPLKRHGLC